MRISSSDRLALENISSSSSSSSRNSGGTREARALGARAKHALGTREARALGARAFAGFNEHPLINYILRSTTFPITTQN